MIVYHGFIEFTQSHLLRISRPWPSRPMVVSIDSAGGGYLTMGIAGGTGGLVCGGSIGALVGLAPAPFTAGQGDSDAENSRRITRFNQISGELL